MSQHTFSVIIDADILSHFIAANEILSLPGILAPCKIIIIDLVYDEIARIRSRKTYLDNFIRCHKKTVSFEEFQTYDIAIKKDYTLLQKNFPLMGIGERICLSVAKNRNDIIASSNFKDISAYCQNNNIKHIGTLDILVIALKKNIFDITKCDNFISTVKNINKARFPNYVKSINDYTPCDISFFCI